MSDQAGITHAHAYNGFGRQVSDSIMSFGAGIDTAVQAITRTYEVRGMMQKVTSLGAGAAIRNQVLMVYDDYAQLVKDRREHNGAGNPGTLSVRYTCEDGSGNTVRPTGIIYPGGATTITIAYGGADADALSRPDGLQEGGVILCSYAYLGSGVIIDVKYGGA